MEFPGFLPDEPQLLQRLASGEVAAFEIIFGQYYKSLWMQEVFSWGSGITIGVACLGLFGMASLASQRRTKEIGIRKVLGAGSGSIAFLLLQQFLSLVLLGMLPALPLAWYLGNSWLASFVYRIPSTLTLLTLAGIITFGLAVLTTLYHSFRASQVDPVKSLRSE